MKRKFLVVLMAIAATLCMAFGLVGCDLFGSNGQKPDNGEQGNTPAPHVHSFGEWKVTKEATCKEEGTKERECACGEKETAVFRTGHDFENMICKNCGIQASLGLKYTLINEDKEYEVSGIGECTDNDIIITNNYQGKPVTSIGSNAFAWRSGLTSIDIPDSVISIGYSAFFDCSGLTSITIPDSVTSIGEGAFWGCSGLTSIDIPDSVISIGYSAFDRTAYYNDNSKWTGDVLYIGNHLIKAKDTISGSYSIRGGTKTIADEAFYRCYWLTSIDVPDSVTSIGYSAFEFCLRLTSIEIPNSVTSIGDEAFSGCCGLTSIEIPNSVTSIGDDAFYSCSGLTSIDIPDSVTSIGDGAFFYCFGLTSITIPKNFTSIGRAAFADCYGLTSITIPDSVTSIGKGAFSNCSGLTSITIGSGVTSIEEWAFGGCHKLIEVWNYSQLKIEAQSSEFGQVAYYAKYVYKDNTPSKQRVTEDGYIFYEEGSESYLLGYTGAKTNLTLPVYSPTEKNYAIYQYAFEYCLGLTSVTVPDSVTSIGKSAFAWCSGLTSITIPNSVMSIGDEVFEGCSGLTSIDIPDSVTSIGSGAFAGCNALKEVHFKNPNGWKVSKNENMSETKDVSGLNDPATATKYLTDTYSYYYWKRG